MNRQPTFFLSSTIHDFKDLRGAVKFLLEERGCRVLASEFNDFRTPLDKHSYDACLANIDQADYFVLLIGNRVGGWFDEAEAVSITRQEYRYAYARHRRGLLRIVTLVRAEVWQMREDRKALARHLEDLELEDSERAAIRAYPSRFATDADVISAFITEIGRNAETAAAAKGDGERPTGNWIHLFRDFRDVHDVLAPLAFAQTTATEAAYAKALQHELLGVSAQLLSKWDGNIYDLSASLEAHLKAWPILKAQRQDDRAQIDATSWRRFSTVMMQTLALRFDIVVLEDALTSSLFLGYDAAERAYRHTPAYEAVHQLVAEIRRFNALATAETLSLVIDYSPKNIGRPEGLIGLPTQKLAMLYSLAHRWVNIARLSSALIRHLDGEAFVPPSLLPFSPIKDLDEAISQERVSANEARAFLSARNVASAAHDAGAVR